MYCIEHAPEDDQAIASMFHRVLGGAHGPVVEQALTILRKRFASDEHTEGYRKDGPVAVAKFELGDEPELREARLLRQRRASELIDSLLSGIEACAA